MKKNTRILIFFILFVFYVGCYTNKNECDIENSKLKDQIAELEKEQNRLEEELEGMKRKYYTITWKNYDGTVLYIENKVEEGKIPEYKSILPTKSSDDIYSYEFAGWEPSIKEVLEDVTYVATYTSVKHELTVTSSHESGFYDNPFSLTLSTRGDATIYYTFDSSIPNEYSYKYESAINIKDISENENLYASKEGISSLDVFIPQYPIDKCVVIKAVAIDSEGIVSDVYCYSFFVGYNMKTEYHNIPIISLVINPDDLYDYEKGIYVTGKIYDENEHTGYPETYPANYQQKGKEWEKKAYFTYFDEHMELSYSQTIGVRIHGGWSRAFNQKSFNLYARKEYSGSKSFDKPFFDTDTMQSCMLRSGGYRDTFVTKARDSLAHELSKNELFSVQNSYPCILFLNGEYWGVYLLQERFTEYYVEEHFGVDKDNVVIIENGEVDEGEDEDINLYNELIDFFKNNDFRSTEKYEEAKKYIDVNEFAAYMATELYIGNIDWPGNNVRMWRARETSDKKYEDGKWHFMMYDTDDSMDMVSNKCHFDSDPFLNKNHWKDGPLDEDCILGLMLTKLIANNEFAEMFKNTFIRIASENFSMTNVNLYLDSFSNKLSQAMPVFYNRFVSSDTNKYNEEYFIEQVEVIKTFFENRYEYAIKYLDEHIILDN